MHKKRVLVVGGNSFVARHFRNFVLENHADCVEKWLSVDREESSYEGNIIEEAVNVLDEEALKKSIIGFEPDYIINFVGSFAAISLNDLINLNVGVSNTICEAVKEGELNVGRILLIGSAAEYGFPEQVPITEETMVKPVNPYGLSKVLQTEAMKYYAGIHHLPVSLARTFNIIGKGISNTLSIGAFVERIKNLDQEGVMKVGNLSAKRDFLDVRDVVAAYWAILQEGKDGEVYNVCRGKSESMETVVKQMINHSGKSVSLDSEQALLRKFDVDDIYGDNSKLINTTGWTPQFSVDQSLAELFN